MPSNEARLVLVTGATRGLGLAIAERLAADGYRIIATGRQPSDALDALIKENPSIAFRALDLGDHESLHPFCTALKEEFGPLYGLVNNAAIARDGVLATIHDSEIAEVVNVNVLGTILLTKYAQRAMFQKTGRQTDARIVNIASVVGTSGASGLSVYGATKAALLGFTRSLAREVGRIGITVNAVSPGYMETEMSAGLGADALAKVVRRSPLGVLSEVQDVAAAVAYLLSDDGKRVTGIELKVDAGATS
ncbi:SDR family NAD(P)-dependent oxidoreductase [Adhaeretor mobilis]|uniref:3-oxoacyl-[acyl-carrier-protein] reductase FabG n=1 Tax=Adhaeretor mobilis TaxID=1930276 RepID=A0A517MPZ7_9BACT|nr:SDR family oxidoreductase [Adhaeretor mobilis]QDS96966.1 3-oxoacyl-[acyl-carrier-protein] reductase FabG [Adhaeretor mobilis]